MENMWAILACRVYADCKQYTNTQVLHGDDIMRNFIDSMKRRLVKVVIDV
jgi:hypothetical protein